MRQFVAIVVAVVIASTSLAAAGPIREAAVATAVEAAIESQQDQPASQRSKARTWGGVILMSVGLLMPVQQEICVVTLFGSAGCATKMYTPGVAAAVGLIGSGVLLATIFADVPARPSVDFTITPDRVQVGKTFGW